MTTEQGVAFMRRLDVLWGARFPMTETRMAGWIEILSSHHVRDVNRALDHYIKVRDSSELDWPPSLPQLLAVIAPLHRRRVLAVERQTARVAAAREVGDADSIRAAEDALESWQ